MRKSRASITYRAILCVFLFSLTARGSHGGDSKSLISCSVLLRRSLHTRPNIELSRREIRAILHDQQVPHQIFVNKNGVAIPVVLINRNTYPALEPLLVGTVSTAVELWNYKNFPTKDHGLHGLGNLLIDVNPVDPHRVGRYGYSHETTVRWRQLGPYLDGRRSGFEEGGKPNAAQLLQVVMLPHSPEDFIAFEIYHKLRRGAFIATDQGVDQHPKRRIDNRFYLLAAETCYEFGTGKKNPEHVTELSRLLQEEMNIKDLGELYRDPRVIAFIEAFKRELLEIDVEKPELALKDGAILEREILGPQLLWKDQYRDMLAHLTEGFPLDKKDRFSRLVFALNVAREFQLVADSLRLSEQWLARDRDGHERGWISNYLNPDKERIMMILVYDENANPHDFANGAYRAEGHVHRLPH